MNVPAIQRAFHDAMKAGVFSGAQVRAGRGGESRFAACFGQIDETPKMPGVGEETLFDIASLTKPLATVTLCMRAEQRKLLDLDGKVQDYLPEFGRPENLTVRQLLAHTSGLPAWLPIYEDFRDKRWHYPEAYPLVQEAFLSKIARAPLEHAPGGRRLYSDLGFILLGFILESLHGKRLDWIFSEEVARPLGLSRTVFNPRRRYPPVPAGQIAATEACPWRGYVLEGEVHDDNAFVLGGIAGHAGLFSTARDIEVWVQELFSIAAGKDGLVSTASLERFLGPRVEPKLGWDTVAKTGSQAGRYFSGETVGHLAFTGCSVWLDFRDRKYVILLSNRVHPRRENEGIKEFRPKIHDLLVESLSLSG